MLDLREVVQDRPIGNIGGVVPIAVSNVEVSDD